MGIISINNSLFNGVGQNLTNTSKSIIAGFVGFVDQLSSCSINSSVYNATINGYYICSGYIG